MNKRDIMEAKKAQWMRQRNEASNLGSTRVSSSATSANHPASGDDRIMEQLSSQIASLVQREVRQNLGSSDVKDSLLEKMDDYLSAELHTHTCKICYELMTGAEHTPLLLFPCGHTFCKTCIDRCRTKANWVCPYCRVSVQTVAVNQSLKQLIDGFVEQKSKVPCSSYDLCTNTMEQIHRGEIPSHYSEASAKQQRAMLAKLQSCEMRRDILLHESEEFEASLGATLRKKQAIAEAVLRAERKDVEAKMAQLQEELNLIDEHEMAQQKKLTEISAAENEVHAKISSIRKTINSLEAEIEKLKILSSS